ncbi:MAG TPA: DUF3501 family protein [Acidimicrobiales bacterium]|nr:DUF3501 family protein [Acidimicrobiales bacterium]
MTRHLTLSDIADLRAYEREREDFRNEVIALKRRRRISVGTLLTFVFENRETIRFQVQEMVRAERMLTDDAVQTELDTYNALVPEPGQLSATLFIELTSKDQLMEWLPKLVGIERSVALELGEGDGDGRGVEVVMAEPEADHAAMLTRDEVTASVHYVRFALTPHQVERFASGPVALALHHPAYGERTQLTPDTVAELLTDLRPDA